MLDFNFITGCICLVAICYIIFLEFKNPKKERDIFIDIMIASIMIVVSLFEMYELNFQFKTLIIWLFALLIVLSAFYIVLVIIHHQALLKEKSKFQDIKEESEEEK